MAPGGRWNERRLVLFTEYEDTRRWAEKRLAEALDELNPDDRIASFTGATPPDRREELKKRFNSDPAVDPLRILVCTDAAREGINLQMRCHDLIHIDLPWNPARLELKWTLRAGPLQCRLWNEGTRVNDPHACFDEK